MTGLRGRIRIRRGGSLGFAAGIPAWSIRHGPPMNLPRSSGVQLHPTSLPSGRLGREAYAFVDWLAEAGQHWWLPGAPEAGTLGVDRGGAGVRRATWSR